MLKIQNLKKIFHDAKKTTIAVNDIDLEFELNKITGLIGFNGSGKTTTYNIISKFLEADKGSVTLNGKPISDEQLITFSYLAAGSEPQNPTKVLTHLTRCADLYFIPKQEALEKINKMAKFLDFREFLEQPIKSLSKGNQQKIKVITALLNPYLKYLILDEPFDGLDPIMVKKVQKLLYSLKGVTIILTSHRMEVVQEMCDAFYIMRQGEVVYHKSSDDKSAIIEVNKEVNVDVLKGKPGVERIENYKDRWAITISDISFFKDLNKELINQEEYIYSSAVYANLAQIVFERYGA